MASITVTHAVSCAPGGGFITLTAISSTLSGTFTWYLASAGGQRLSGPAQPLPVTIGPLANDDWTLRVAFDADSQSSTPEVIEIACGPAPDVLVLDSLTHTDPTSVGGTGSLTVLASGGLGPYLVEVLPAGLSQTVADFSSPVTFANLPPGTYTVRVTDSSVPSPQQVSGTVTIAAYVAPVLGCMDEDALNYDPNATESGACSYAPRWRSAWEPMEVVAVAPLPTAAYLEAELWAGFPAGHPRAAAEPLTLLTKVRATVSPGGLATFRLGPLLRPLLGAADGHGGQRLDLNSPTAATSDLYVGYDLRLPGSGAAPDGRLLQRGLALNSSLPDAQLRTTPGTVLTPFGTRLPVWPGFADYVVSYYDLQADRYGFLATAPAQALAVELAWLPCPKNPMPVAWLAPGGGFAVWVFSGRPRYGVDIQEGTLFREAETGERRWSNRGEALQTITASSGIFSGQDLAEGLRSLRTSPQVWYQPEPGGPWVPVMLESGSFAVHRKGVNRNEVLVQFSESLPLPAQGQ